MYTHIYIYTRGPVSRVTLTSVSQIYVYPDVYISDTHMHTYIPIYIYTHVAKSGVAF